MIRTKTFAALTLITLATQAPDVMAQSSPAACATSPGYAYLPAGAPYQAGHAPPSIAAPQAPMPDPVPMLPVPAQEWPLKFPVRDDEFVRVPVSPVLERDEKQWYQLSNAPGWEGYGKLEASGFVSTERFRRIDDHSVIAAPGAISPEWAARSGAVTSASAPPSMPTTAVEANDNASGFIGWLNGVRARYGLGAVVHDPSLDGVCDENNRWQASLGIGHFFMGHARRQNSAMGLSFPGDAWMGSPGHQSALLDPTIMRCGIRWLGSYCTFSAY